MSIRADFEPYEGEKDYIFISYSHNDTCGVFPIISRLNAEGFRIWYDNIGWGKKWRSELEERIKFCRVFISFQSKSTSKKSSYCAQEIYHADNEHKAILYIYLDQLKDDEIVKPINHPHDETQSAFFYQYKDYELEEFLSRLICTELLQPCRDADRKTDDTAKYTDALRSWLKSKRLKRIQNFAAITIAGSIAACALLFCGYKYASQTAVKPNSVTLGQWDVFGLASSGTPDRIRQALNSGVNFSIIGTDGDTPLHKAAASNIHPESIELLLSLGLDVNARGKDRCTVLMRAAENPNPEIVRVLLRNGADVSQYADGESALSIAAGSRNDNPETVRLLLEAYSKSERESLLDGETRFLRCQEWFVIPGNVFRLTILGVAVQAGNPKTVQYLVDAGCDAEAANYDGITTLMLAAALSGSDEVVRIMSRAVKDVNARDNFGRTALQEAVSAGSIEMVKILLNAGADVNAADNDGETALMHACMRTYRTDEKTLAEMIMLLLSADADVNAEGGNYFDDEGRHTLMTAADFAKDNKYLKNNQAVIRLLAPDTKSDNP